jgi:hypothetical protein
MINLTKESNGKHKQQLKIFVNSIYNGESTENLITAATK